MILKPDEWAVEASALPLAFAQVREDPRHDMLLAKSLPAGASVVMIASGGDTAAYLGRLPLRFHLVDMNPAQLAISQLKWHLAELGNWNQTMTLLGHIPIPDEDRQEKLGSMLHGLGLAEDALGPMKIVSRLGPDHAGRYERTFSELRTHLAPWETALDQALHSRVPVQNLHSSPLGEAIYTAFTAIMKLENLVCLFGEQATQNPKRSFGEHFALRTLEAFSRMPPYSNPFLWQILAGVFPPGYRYDWMNDGHPLTLDKHWYDGKMDAVLDSLSSESADLIHLSNILDWLSVTSAQAMLDKAHRVLKSGGRVIIRQLNSSLDIPAIDSGFVWDHELGGEMESTDRSYFYPGIFVGSKK